ncbi:hypothetical protein [Pseudomonas sp. CGJS7]|uniref:hypothetical protein n=1 Tax=Pseudomonas sp. CGJS7 TaxID=3109348 RepID=UPI00300AE4E3
MNDPSLFPDEWQAMKQADDGLRISRWHLRQRDDFKDILLRALGDLSEQAHALRLLRDDADLLSDAQLTELAPKIVDIAVDGNVDRLIVARAVLVRYAAQFKPGRQIVKDSIDRLMDGYFGSNDDFIYRRLAELLIDIGHWDALKRLLVVSKDHRDPEIADLHGDYLPHLP